MCRNNITALELYDPNLPITKQKLLSIKRSNPDFLSTLRFQEAVIQTIRILKEINYYPLAIFHQTGTFTLEEVLSALGKDADYVVCATVWAEGLTKKLPAWSYICLDNTFSNSPNVGFKLDFIITPF